MGRAGRLPALVQVQYCFASIETTRTIRDGEPRAAFLQYSLMLLYVHRETVRTIRDGEPRAAFLQYSLMLLYVHRDHKDY